MDLGMVVTFVGIIVAALAGVLGVWMERDRTAPPRWAWVFSLFIVLAMFVELWHSVVQAREDAQTDEAMVRVLEQLTTLAANGDNPALEQFVDAELALQARANPALVDKLEERVEEHGGDASAVRARATTGRRTAAGLPAVAPSTTGAARRGGTGPGSTSSRAGAGISSPGARTKSPATSGVGTRPGATSDTPGTMNRSGAPGDEDASDRTGVSTPGSTRGTGGSRGTGGAGRRGQ